MYQGIKYAGGTTTGVVGLVVFNPNPLHEKWVLDRKKSCCLSKKAIVWIMNEFQRKKRKRREREREKENKKSNIIKEYIDEEIWSEETVCMCMHVQYTCTTHYTLRNFLVIHFLRNNI